MRIKLLDAIKGIKNVTIKPTEQTEFRELCQLLDQTSPEIRPLDFSVTWANKHSLLFKPVHTRVSIAHLGSSTSGMLRHPQQCQQELHPFLRWIRFPDNKCNFLVQGTDPGLLPSGCAEKGQRDKASLWQFPIFLSEPISCSWMLLSVPTFHLEWFGIKQVWPTSSSKSRSDFSSEILMSVQYTDILVQKSKCVSVQMNEWMNECEYVNVCESARVWVHKCVWECKCIWVYAACIQAVSEEVLHLGVNCQTDVLWWHRK